MKTPNPKLVALALLAVLIGVGLWWFTQPSASVPQKNAPASASTSAKPDAPQPTTRSTQIAAPIAPPVLTKPNAAASAATAKAGPPVEANDPQADLKTVIPDIARLLHAGDLVAMVQNYTPPDKLTPELMQIVQNAMHQRETAKPEMQAMIREMNASSAQAYEAFESQTPIFNDAGDEATYTSLILSNGSGEPLPITFVKISGKWYLKTPRY